MEYLKTRVYQYLRVKEMSGKETFVSYSVKLHPQMSPKNPLKTSFSFSQLQPYSVTSHFTYDEKLLVKASLILQT